MKVAIIGAGLSGLSCAHELEKYNISPVIYEKNSFIGEAYSHATAILGISHKPIKDSIEFFRKDYGIDIKPLNTIHTLEHHAPNKIPTLHGNFGYTFRYTKDETSMKNQIYKKLKKTQVIFNAYGDYKVLSKTYDFVVIATGSPIFAEEIGIWQTWMATYVRGAVLLGDFDPNTLIMWINKDYCKNGYAYLSPFDDKKAAVILVANDVNEKEIDHYWELFVYTENIKSVILEEFKLSHTSGLTFPRQTDNLIFIGNAAGGVDPFLGFGHMNAIVMGVSAARTIAKGKDYEKQIKSIIKRNIQMRDFRKAFDVLSNKDYDNIISLLGMPGVKQILYSSPFNISKFGALASTLFLKTRKK